MEEWIADAAVNVRQLSTVEARLRDEFAAAALPLMLGRVPATAWDFDAVATDCYRMADALLTARQQ